ncbi:uroporphyrinogen-III synthase [Oceanobacillus salinisoli]|uniref:uroporphyrinogen-III synthase n=1 Tax=Oceanobacillus salinisoli TaxID=2678611 RepID=UPI0012E1D6AC|nr:uroporphyrinogen-III synthase [Oceanobacillus salinisoli]
MSSSLQGRKVIVTRDMKGAKQFSRKIVKAGGQPIEVPLLTITCDDRKENKRIFNDINQYDWIVFTSANGVECFFQLVGMYHVSLEELKTLKIAVVGQKTNKKLKKYGFSADFVPSRYNADTLAREFLLSIKNPGTVLLVRGNLSRTVLPRELKRANIPYDSLYVYRTRPNDKNRVLLNNVLQKSFDFMTFTSPSAIEAFFTLSEYPLHKPCVCIGTTTEQRAREKGISTVLTPETFTIDAMIDCMIDYINKKE